MNIASSRLMRSVSAIAVLLLSLSLPAWGADEKPEKDAPPIPKVEQVDGKIPAVFTKPAPEGVDDLKAMQKHVKKMLEKVMPATVGLVVGSGSGSGVIISEDGYILTAGHVSGTPDRKCTVIMPDGKRLDGKTLGYNKTIDSGLVKITDKGKYPFVGLGESGKLQTGQWCMTLGHPGGFRPGRSPVLRLGRILASNKNLIRTDCALVGGDSGGPLFDVAGRVIGIHSRISTGITENIHVPVDTYRETWDRLVASEEWGGMFDFGGGRRLAKAVLGVGFSRDGTDLKILELTKGGPAEKAGFMEGDIITAIDGMKVKVRADLQGYLMKKKPGDEVKVEVEREDEKETITLKLGKRPNS
jgi:serine protease Do